MSGVLAFEWVTIAIAWIEMETTTAIMATSIMFSSLSWTVICAKRSHARFRIRAADKVKFDADLRDLIEMAEN